MHPIKNIFVFGAAVAAVFLFGVSQASAHQPRIATDETTVVTNPEISQAYYGELKGEPHAYTIVSDEPFTLYVNILVPDVPGHKKDVSAAVIKDGEVDAPLAVLEGAGFDWVPFFEPFGQSAYLRGPEYRAEVGPGTYDVRVWSSNNDSTYSLAIGEQELFGFAETVNAVRLIPMLKRDFFHESPATFIFSPIGAGYVAVMFVLAFAFGLAYRVLLRRVAGRGPRTKHRNIGTIDRVARALLGVLILAFAIMTTWNPFMLFLAGFLFFESLFSWCGLYAALGKNTCPA